MDIGQANENFGISLTPIVTSTLIPTLSQILTLSPNPTPTNSAVISYQYFSVRRFRMDKYRHNTCPARKEICSKTNLINGHQMLAATSTVKFKALWMIVYNRMFRSFVYCVFNKELSFAVSSSFKPFV